MKSYTVNKKEGGYILLPVVTLISLLAITAYIINSSGSMNIHLTGGRGMDDQAYFVGEAGIHHARWQINRGGSFADIPTTTFGNETHTYSVTITPKNGSFPVKITVTVLLANGTSRKVTRYYYQGSGNTPQGCDPSQIPDINHGGFSTASFGGGNDVWGITYLPEGKLFSGVASPEDGAWILSNYNSDTYYMTNMNGNQLASFDPDHSNYMGIAFVTSGSNADTIASVRPNSRQVHYIDLNGNDTGVFDTNDFTTDPSDLTFISTTATGLYKDHLAIVSKSDQAVYIVKQSGDLKNTIDVSDLMSAPTGVAHFANTNKLLVMNDDGDGYIFDFAGILYGQYSGSGMDLTEPKGTAINPLTCEHVFADKADSNVDYLKKN